MNELMEIPPWAIWCAVAVGAFVVGLGWGLLIDLPETWRTWRRGL